ncbi:MAG: winged helix-turn-helix transcriptional regulator [Candidatus Methanofastidiosia archaeon]|jgi:DNA-binding HxlR family transcriptional regulator
MKKEERILKLIGSAGTKFILEYLNTHTETQYKELNRTLAPHTLNTRLRELSNFKLVEHHFEKKEKRKEWYIITERGKRVLQIMKNLEAMVDEQ